MATTTTLMNLGDGTCVVVKQHAYEFITLEEHDGRVLRTLTRDEAKVLLKAKGFIVE